MVWYALGSILLPVLGSALILFIPERHVKKVSQFFSFLAFICGLLLLITFATTSNSFTQDLLTISGINLFGVTIDTLSVLVNFMVVFIGWLICTYSAGYMNAGNREHPVKEGIPRFYAFMLLFIGSMSGLVFSSTLLGLLFFFEMTGLCSWNLIGFYGDQKSRRSALWAIILTHFASLGLYVAAAYVFISTGSFSVAALSKLTETGKIVAFIGILIASWGKSAQLPLHPWLPRAMVAPTPVSAYLHAASMVKVGVYIFARTVLEAGSVPQVIGEIGVIMAVVTMVYGFVMYFPQDDMKKLLAYSTIAQLSYIFLAVSLSIYGSKMAFDGAVAHIFNHAFAKGLFFLVAGALAYTTGTRRLSMLKGILKKTPVIGLGYIAAAMAITGVPPFNGFFSKFMIILAGFEIGIHHPLVLVLMIVTMIESVGSFIWILKWMGVNVLGAPSDAVANAAAPPLPIKFVLSVLIIMTLISQYIVFLLLS
ncbi:hydrogenase 4 subunit D [Parageobacillus thermoglucosidasius]|uniref:Hydrogenase 4 subunit D n=1 Tax=Parageobacillus thermoglucosidasius TaxID=1426 RepID=A0AAN0YPG4_PARTM|nr:hydrogenase 4 subunit D [Parageobacillus thermoglucosidasius]ALF10922.1 hydrogenase 4 subunit D [Parageobacillus thermoglucosidasius]ANZ30998.1 hydrogenase 4 subunit D [Parageobacillus thermoglucosidasius]APM81735.1 hydrogenase 4 subunit D [Parageobacillus thermoglucosidasius]KJX69189.1 hydrogenase 4 subunit D [Parageobacillus thermoglucosidasius]RDE25470.1 hydrogenase 4 subunit D [Parageobacillus thermoglucosidasius]